MTASVPRVATGSVFESEAALCADHGLTLERLASYGWLVRQRASPVGPVIACIDECDDCVELMEMDGGFHWSTFPSLLAAIEHLVDQPRAQRDRL